ncbi:MAG TPA: multiheme c-type cytochrome [Terracidiphilus sp.]
MATASILVAGMGSPVSNAVPNAPATGRPAPPPRSDYAGDEACAECHRTQAVSYVLTPHARDSAPADRAHILGSFSPGHNVLHTSNPHIIVAMTEEKNGFYESGMDISDPNHPTGQAQRIDIAIGSGRHAQTYLYWDGDQLYELPVSYWGWGREWVLSPGFPSGQVRFDRPVVPRCLECHGSYFTWLNPPANRYVKDSVVLGIECERCHGPGAKHVALERSAKKPDPKTELAIVNPARLSHQQQLDLCSLCHAGAVQPIGDSLRFLPGDTIRDYLHIQPVDPAAPPDVHGNQVGALEASRCFGSGKITCSTCHNVHRVQENAESFSAHCQTCHELRACGKYKTLGAAIRTRCIDCHMPLLDSAKIVTSTGEQKLHALLRAHRIAIYKEAGAEVEQSLKAH